MARYEHLPIYKAALDAAVYFEKVVEGFSRYHKYTRGTELRNASREVVEQVIRANAARNRAPELLGHRGLAIQHSSSVQIDSRAYHWM